MSECKHVWDERNYEHDLYGCAKCDRELSIDEVIVMLNEHATLKREKIQLIIEQGAWFDLCRAFIGGGDEHILRLRNAYLGADDATRC